MFHKNLEIYPQISLILQKEKTLFEEKSIDFFQYTAYR